jgi:acid phosphatase family membrane protein YuiD
VRLTQRLRKLTFTAHVTASVGWLGAVIVFLALAVVALTNADERTVRGAYLVMAPAAWFVLVPLAHASLVSGVVLSLGTTWGLFRHYWILVKLGITAFATVILMIYMGTFRQMAGVAADPVVELGLVRNPSPLVHSILALILLVVATLLGIYKPFGETPYGRRIRNERHPGALAQAAAIGSFPGSASRRTHWVWMVVIGLIALFIAAHLISGGAHGQ